MAKEFKAMFYNLENFFDTSHDDGKNDYAYLPKISVIKKEGCAKSGKHFFKDCMESDWGPKELEQKSANLSVVIKAANPDLLGVCEIENEVAAKLIQNILGPDEFDYVITNSGDERGIDVALFFRKSIFKKAVTEFLRLKINNPTRDILYQKFTLTNGKTLNVFVNHWPSQGNPVEHRLIAAETLAQKVKFLNSKDALLIMGDFNVIEEDFPNPLKTVLEKELKLSDVYRKFMANNKISSQDKKETPAGTYFYPPKMQWNFLDHFFINDSFIQAKKLNVKLNTFQIFNIPENKHDYIYSSDTGAHASSKIVGVPKKGVSDHFPITVIVNYL
jgi:endonuclease/exonuclease/phosphatase family metal-dependent hydrolase